MKDQVVIKEKRMSFLKKKFNKEVDLIIEITIKKLKKLHIFTKKALFQIINLMTTNLLF